MLESEYLFQSSLAYMGTAGALYSHPDADIEKGSASVNQMYYNAMARIPYLTGGKSGDDMMNAERMRLIDQYKQMRDNLTPKTKKDAGG